jgi:capsular polysaccharide biosynthesis protein
VGYQNLHCVGFAGVCRFNRRFSTSNDGGLLMSEVRPPYDDEIDLFELFETLWDGKWLISAFVVLATLIGFGYSQVAQPNYKVSVPYRVNISSVFSQQMCNSKDCLADGTLNILLESLSGEWEVSAKYKTITLMTLSPFSLNKYETIFSDALSRVTESIRNEAASELASIESISNANMLATERVATNMLNAKRIIQSIDNGQSAMTLGFVSVSKTSPKVPLILALSVVFGGMIGVFFILVRNAIRKRKKQLSEA